MGSVLINPKEISLWLKVKWPTFRRGSQEQERMERQNDRGLLFNPIEVSQFSPDFQEIGFEKPADYQFHQNPNKPQ